MASPPDTPEGRALLEDAYRRYMDEVAKDIVPSDGAFYGISIVSMLNGKLKATPVDAADVWINPKGQLGCVTPGTRIELSHQPAASIASDGRWREIR